MENITILGEPRLASAQDATYINLGSPGSSTSKAAQRVKKDMKSKQKRLKKRMSHKKLKAAGVYDISVKGKKFQDFEAMNAMWNAYIFSVAGKCHRNNAQALLLKCDLHGAMLHVEKSKNPALVRVGGVVLMESKHTFRVMTRDHALKTLPKKGSVFRLEAPTLPFAVLIYGDQFCQRGPMRTNHNYKKTSASIDL